MFKSKKVITPRGVKRKTKSSEQSNDVPLAKEEAQTPAVLPKVCFKTAQSSVY